MTIQDLIKAKNISVYRLSKNSGIPYATLADIVSGKTQLRKCSAETVYKLSKELDVKMEDLLAPYFLERCSFELFKSNICHRVKELGDVDFIIDTLEKDDIRSYFNRQWYPESFYLLAMLDYLSRINDIPICEDYNDIRGQKLQNIIYPESVIALTAVSKNDAFQELARKESIPEFMQFNIVELEVRSVI